MPERPTLFDRVLDATVVPGYTRLGYLLRRRSWDDLPEEAAAGQTIVVTGATSGLGLAAAERLSGLGGRLVLVGRSAERLAEAAGRMSGPTALHRADLSSMAEVHDVARRILETEPRIDVLINNVGVLFPERSVTEEGLEATFALNLASHFLLTNLLIPRLVDSAPSRIVNVSSGGMYTQAIDLDDLQSERAYRGAAAYARAKRAQVDLTAEWASRLTGAGVVVHAMHPGWADTPGVREALPGFRRLIGPVMRSAEEGADTIVWLAVAGEAAESTGLFWHDRRPRATARVKGTETSPGDRAALWDELARITGLSDLPA